MNGLVLVLVAVLCSCSATQPQAQAVQTDLKQTVISANEYIITLGKGINIDELKKQLADYSLVVVKDMGRSRYLVRFQQDPGLEVIKTQACFKTPKCQIQPNFKYQHF